ncbi:hypothetical protein B0H13DRAFT_1893840 [Mycena leptocephala]|nr:hypothetical protein B0H13DRAFT_1893840 [Mycena leptocephala]
MVDSCKLYRLGGFLPTILGPRPIARCGNTYVSTPLRTVSDSMALAERCRRWQIACTSPPTDISALLALTAVSSWRDSLNLRGSGATSKIVDDWPKFRSATIGVHRPALRLFHSQDTLVPLHRSPGFSFDATPRMRTRVYLRYTGRYTLTNREPSTPPTASALPAILPRPRWLARDGGARVQQPCARRLFLPRAFDKSSLFHKLFPSLTDIISDVVHRVSRTSGPTEINREPGFDSWCRNGQEEHKWLPLMIHKHWHASCVTPAQRPGKRG